MQALLIQETTIETYGEDEDGNSMINEYSIIGNLGEGSYSEVKLCMNFNNQPFVLLFFKKKILLPNFL